MYLDGKLHFNTCTTLLTWYFSFLRDYKPRQIQIEKKDTLGISIASASRGGIFVCSVSKGSVAYKAGLRYGDQLLEVICSKKVLISCF